MVNNLAPGNYTIDVTDGQGCSLSAPVIINAVDCNSLTLQMSNTNETTYQANNGTATATVSGGTSPYVYNWSNGQSTASINNLNPNSYIINIIDFNGCPVAGSVSVLPYVCDSIDVEVRKINESCFGSSDGLLIINSIQNGTLPYAVEWDSGITGNVNNNLSSGSYGLQITDAKNCPFNNSYRIFSESNMSTSYLVDNETSQNANDGMINLSVNYGIPPYTYSWSNGKNTEDISNLSAGNYSVTIEDNNNCVIDVIDIIVGTELSVCPINLVENNSPVVNTMQVRVQQYIQTNAFINNGNVVSYKAGSYIELMDSFEVKQGAEFEAIIEDCN